MFGQPQLADVLALLKGQTAARKDNKFAAVTRYQH